MEQLFLNFPCLEAFCVRGTLDPGSNYREGMWWVEGGREGKKRMNDQESNRNKGRKN